MLCTLKKKDDRTVQVTGKRISDNLRAKKLEPLNTCGILCHLDA